MMTGSGVEMIAIRQAQRAGLVRRGTWAPNLVAGVIVGVVALPQSMAFAIASGAKPEQGLYTTIVSAIIVSLSGGASCRLRDQRAPSSSSLLGSLPNTESTVCKSPR